MAPEARRISLVVVLAVLLLLPTLILQSQNASAQAPETGVACNASGGSGGLSPGEYDVTLGGRQALLYVGSGYSPSNPSILSFYLHGDGAGDRPFMSTERRALLDDNGWIYVAPRAINNVWYSGGVTSAPGGNVTIEANAQLLEDVIEELFDDYNLCRNVLLGSSASGGSWFYDAYFLATRGDRYPAYMDLGCGSSGINAGWSGFPFYANLLTFNTDADILARTKLHYSIGTDDFLYPGAQQAIPHLRSLGFDVTTDIRSGVAHCAYDVDQTAVRWWTELCEDGFIPVASRNAAGQVRPESCSPDPTVDMLCADLVVTINMNTNGGNGVGTPGDDVILGTSNADVIDGLGGNDTICAGAGDDDVSGGPGDDSIYAGSGADTVDAGDDNDFVSGASGNDVIRGGDGNDELSGSSGDDKVYGEAGDDEVLGSTGDDTLSGGPGVDRILGSDGVDTINAGGGNDRVRGGPGNDVINGAGGDDSLYGEAGDDAIEGGAGLDFLHGGEDNDTLMGGEDNDRFQGFTGDDIIDGGDGDDRMSGYDGNDEMSGGDGMDSVYGGDGDDDIWGDGGDDKLYGQLGNDFISAGSGDDDVYGSHGNDELFGGSGEDYLHGSRGVDFLDGGNSNDTCYANGAEPDTLVSCEL